MLSEYPSLGAYIESIEFLDVVTHHAIAMNDILNMIKSLINVKTLTATDKLATILSLKVIALTSLPNMQHLYLSEPIAHRSSCWNLQYFRHLPLYRNLHTLSLGQHEQSIYPPGLHFSRLFDIALATHLGITVEEMFKGGYLEDLEAQKQTKLQLGLVSTSAVTTFNFYGSIESIFLPRLIASFPYLNRLGLSDYSSPKLFDLIDHLSHINRLRVLDLNLPADLCRYQYARMDRNIFILAISMLSSLKTFYLPPHLITITEILPLLLNLSTLENLIIPNHTIISMKTLESFIQPGPNQLLKLKILTLNMVIGQKSSKRVENLGPRCYYYPEDDVNDPIRISCYNGWSLPNWTEEFSEKGLVNLINLSESGMVKIQGSSVEALGIIEAYNEDVELASKIWNNYCDAKRSEIEGRERAFIQERERNNSKLQQEKERLRLEQEEAEDKEEEERLEQERIQELEEEAQEKKALEVEELRRRDGEFQRVLEEWEKGEYKEFFLFDLGSR